MYIVWYASAVAIGLALGFCIGMFLRGLMANWESAEISQRIFMTVITAIFGGASFGATKLFGRLVEGDNLAFYFLGVGLGLLLGASGWLYPTRRFTVKEITGIVQMSDSLAKEVKDVHDRASMIALQFLSPKAIEREAKISEAELAGRLERAADAVAGSDDEASPSAEQNNG